MLHEVNIGTSDTIQDSRGGGDVDIQQQAPALSVVEKHVQSMRVELCGQPRPPSGYASSISIPGTVAGLPRVAALIDLLDQIRYWATEEATIFKNEPSVLAETEAPEAVVACICSQRPHLVAQALRAVQPMMGHCQTASEIRRVIVDLWAQREGDNLEVSLPAGCDPLFHMLADVLEQQKGFLPVLVEALSTATAVLIQSGATREDSDDAGNSDDVSDVCVSLYSRAAPLVVALRETTMVHQTEFAMRRYPDVVQLQAVGVAFCAALVDIPCSPVVEIDGEEETLSSLADIVAYSDGLLDVLHAALLRHRQHLGICRGVIHVWRVCAQQPGNRLALFQHGAYASALQQLRQVGPYTVDVWREIAETVGYFTPLLDTFQRRSLALTLHELLQRRPQLEAVELVLALLLSLLIVLDSGHHNGGERSNGVFNMYSMYPQPPLVTPPPNATDTAVQQHRHRRKAVLRLSPFQWHPAHCHQHGSVWVSDGDTWSFLLEQCMMPQLVSGLHQYLSNCETVDEEDASQVDRVCSLAHAVLDFF